MGITSPLSKYPNPRPTELGVPGTLSSLVLLRVVLDLLRVVLDLLRVVLDLLRVVLDLLRVVLDLLLVVRDLLRVVRVFTFSLLHSLNLGLQQLLNARNELRERSTMLLIATQTLAYGATESAC
ncbi:hypothetical protein Tsp_10257 [Trichinella spiralis]|uniref:hypothetical protein n=1 Tax=Trichinella spiralis TaxID=6334 RepID=UPI0001EFDFBE|nr:hypothetical protein Tsp_10257 [Trichinella spiralis]